MSELRIIYLFPLKKKKTSKGKIKGSEHCSDPGSQKIVWTQSGNWNLTHLLSLDMFSFLGKYCDEFTSARRWQLHC